MDGFGSPTFSLINSENERFWVKFHFKTQQGIKNLTDAGAASIVAGDRESHQRDLYETIEEGDFPKWTLFDNTARAIGGARIDIQKRHIENCTKADPAYGIGVAQALGLEV